MIVIVDLSIVLLMFPLSCARVRARTTFRLARTAFSYWRTLGIGDECYCSRGRPMHARRNKIRGNIADTWSHYHCAVHKVCMIMTLEIASSSKTFHVMCVVQFTMHSCYRKAVKVFVACNTKLMCSNLCRLKRNGII